MRLPDTFVEQYKHVTPNWGFDGLGYVIYKRTYARYLPDEGRTEDWYETVRRVVEGNFSIDVGTGEDPTATVEEAERLYHAIFNFAILLSGRNLWMGGTPYLKRIADAAQNCWGLAVKPDGYELPGVNLFSVPFPELTARPSFPFAFTADQLMKGGGVGAAIGQEHLALFPDVKHAVDLRFACTKWHPNAADLGELAPAGHRIVIDDSREGWYEAIATLIDAHFVDGWDRFTFDVSEIRPYGERIEGFGGKAAGPGPLVDCLRAMNDVLNARAGQRLRPIDAGDMIQLIGRCVVAGNVRRSALLLLGDSDDEAFLASKDYEHLENPAASQWRWASNNSLIWDENTDLRALAERVYQNGEPGLINLELARSYGRTHDLKDDHRVVTTNPCVTGDTWVLTEEGPRRIQEIEGRPVGIVVDGKVYPSFRGSFVTGTKPVYKITTSEGYSIKATANHKLLAADGKLGSYPTWVEVENLRPGYYLQLGKHLGVSWQGDGTFDEGWLLGEMIGDGGFGDLYEAYVRFWGDERERLHDRALSLVKGLESSRASRTLGQRRSTKVYDTTEVSSVRLSDLAKRFGVERRTKDTMNDVLEKASSDFYRGFIRGLFDADGSVEGNTHGGLNVSLSQSNLPRLEMVQRMLQRLGIASKIYKGRNKASEKAAGGMLLPDGHGGLKFYSTKEGYQLSITRDNLYRFQELIGFEVKEKAQKLADRLAAYTKGPYPDQFRVKVAAIEYVGEETVYDITVDDAHEFDANGIRAHNCGEIALESGEPCNLAEISPLGCEAINFPIEEALRLATRYAYRITFLPFEWAVSREVIRRNRRIGISLTGLQDWFLLHFGRGPVAGWGSDGPYWDAEIAETVLSYYELVRSTNNDHAIALHAVPSIKVTTNKPSGTVSLLGGVAPGIHAHWAPYMIRRVQFGADDPLLNTLEAAGYPIESRISGRDAAGRRMYDERTKVVEFPVKVPSADALGFQSAGQLTLGDQLALEAFMQECWADNAVSTTAYFHRADGFSGTLRADDAHVLDELVEMLGMFRNRLKSTALLPYATGTYEQMPYEEITAVEYERRREALRPVQWGRNVDIVRSSITEDVLNIAECDSGACPIR